MTTNCLYHKFHWHNLLHLYTHTTQQQILASATFLDEPFNPIVCLILSNHNQDYLNTQEFEIVGRELICEELLEDNFDEKNCVGKDA